MEFLLINLPKIINSAGLLCDIAGAFLIWKYGLPEPITKTGAIYITHGVDEAEKKKAESYETFSKWGLKLLILGFILQLISNFIPNIK